MKDSRALAYKACMQVDISKITDYLYVGSQIGEEHVDELKIFNFNLIISMIGQRPIHPVYTEPPFKSIWIRTYDHFLTPISMQSMVRGVQAALPEIRKGGRVLIFCMEGRHRSIAMSAAILIAMGHSSAKAIDMLMAGRRIADPKIWYIRKRILAFERHWREISQQTQEDREVTLPPENFQIKKLQIIVNPSSGKFEPTLAVLNESLRAAGVSWDVSITKRAGEAQNFAEEAVKKNPDAIAVYGGDGTIMEVVSGMMGSSIPLVILPGGSANVFASDLGIPKKLADACTLIARRENYKVRTVDVGKIGNRYFLLRVGLGFEADMVKGADRKVKNRVGILAYFISGWRAFLQREKVTYRIVLDDETIHERGITCLIANSGFIGISDFSLDRKIDISDGLLDVIVVKTAHVSLLKYALNMVFGRNTEKDGRVVKHWQGKEVSVAARPRQAIQCDGELMDDVPALLRMRVVPRALNVVVPYDAATITPPVQTAA